MPHVCGDEPDDTERIDPVAAVCPTYVGMNRPLSPLGISKTCMPHVCGDEPAVSLLELLEGEYAPRMWG